MPSHHCSLCIPYSPFDSLSFNGGSIQFVDFGGDDADGSGAAMVVGSGCGADGSGNGGMMAAWWW